ncbi:MAG TPA: hypothetical protein VG228_05745 [Solirubrobacteraceae bacterium]|jgi:hypothetical protein|nr:hypothetical protein [Solirubrobacteraceae bacterium]
MKARGPTFGDDGGARQAEAVAHAGDAHQEADDGSDDREDDAVIARAVGGHDDS